MCDISITDTTLNKLLENKSKATIYPNSIANFDEVENRRFIKKEGYELVNFSLLKGDYPRENENWDD